MVQIHFIFFHPFMANSANIGEMLALKLMFCPAVRRIAPLTVLGAADFGVHDEDKGKIRTTSHS